MTRKLLLTMLLMMAASAVGAQASPLDAAARCVKATGHVVAHGVASGAKAVEGCVRKVMH